MKKVILTVAASLIFVASFAVCFTSEPAQGGTWTVTYYSGETTSSSMIQTDSYESLSLAQAMTSSYNSCCEE